MTETAQKATPAAPVDQDALTTQDLARAVLEQGLRPRAASIRRLAEAVLAAAAPKVKKDKKAKKKDSGKKGKLAKIPGQKK